MGAFVRDFAPPLRFLVQLWQLLLLLRVFLSWVGADPANPLLRLLSFLCDPFLDWLKRRLPFLVQAGWDFSPLAALLIAHFIYHLLWLSLARWGGNFQAAG